MMMITIDLKTMMMVTIEVWSYAFTKNIVFGAHMRAHMGLQSNFQPQIFLSNFFGQQSLFHNNKTEKQKYTLSHNKAPNPQRLGKMFCSSKSYKMIHVSLYFANIYSIYTD